MIKKIIEFFEKRKIVSWILLVTTWLAMFCFSSISGSSIGNIGMAWAPIAYHFTIFAVFAFFLMTIVKKRKIGMKEIIIVLLVSIVFAILDEVHQIFVPFRTAGIEDVLVDTSGVIFSIILYYIIKKD